MNAKVGKEKRMKEWMQRKVKKREWKKECKGRRKENERRNAKEGKEKWMKEGIQR